MRSLLVVVLVVLSGCAAEPETGRPSASSIATSEDDNADPELVRAAGRDLVADGEPVRLKAVNFTNRYDTSITPADLLTSEHHSAQDFARVRDMGFNSIRFVMRGDWYEEDPQSFWAWLDQNVAWARENNVWLVLDLHIPIGGYWLDPGSSATSFDVWSDPALRERNVQLWREIAQRYRDEPAVAAYDLLNEPVTTDSSGNQWRDLAQQMVDAIRAEDDQHLVVVGGVYGVDGRFDPEGRERHVLVEDSNVMYDFHFYDPYPYTHQYAPWVDPARDGGRYPDPDHLTSTADPTVLPGERIATSSLPEGTSGWRPYDSGVVTIDDASAAAALPQAVVEGGMTGTVFFDRVTVTEYGPDGTRLRTVVEDPLNGSTTPVWYSWGNGDTAGSSVRLDREASGHQDDGSLSVAGTVDSGAGWNSSEHLFKVVPGHRYRIQGYMRGEDVVLTQGDRSRIGFKLAVYAQNPDAPHGGFLARDKDYLADAMAQHLRFGADHDVPMSVMEFGAVRQVFEMEGKGGERWVGDMLELLAENDLSFAYWEYHDSAMGIYLNKDGAPSQPNAALLEVLRRELPEDGS